MEQKDMINPDHYKAHPIECIDEMEIAFGIDAVINFCICNAWKYRYRSGYKDDSSQEQKKADWYMLKAEELTMKRDNRLAWEVKYVEGNGRDYQK